MRRRFKSCKAPVRRFAMIGDFILVESYKLPYSTNAGLPESAFSELACRSQPTQRWTGVAMFMVKFQVRVE